MEVSDIFRIVRAKNKLNQTEFATSLNIKQSHLSLIETGKSRASLKLLETLSEKYNCKINYSLEFD